MATHEHIVPNTDELFEISAVDRTIKQPSGKLKLIQNDHNSERYGFKMPRYIDGHDMTLCNDVRINYINVGSNNSEQAVGPYVVKDFKVDPDDENVITFSWLVSRNSTKYAGTLNFAISFRCLMGSIVEYAWFTDIYKGIIVVSSIDNSGDEVVEDYIDILNQWKEDVLDGLGGGGTGTAKPWLKGTTTEITPTDVVEALEDDQNVMMSYTSDDMGPVVFTSFVISAEGNFVASSCTISIENEMGVIQLIGNISDNTWTFLVEPLSMSNNEVSTDISLSVAGAAADARVTGRAVTQMAMNIPVETELNKFMDEEGSVWNDYGNGNGYICKYTAPVKVNPGETINYKGFSDKGMSVAWSRVDGIPLSAAAYQSSELDGDYGYVEIVVPEDAAFAIFASTRAMPDPENPPEVPFNVYRGGERIGEVAQVYSEINAIKNNTDAGGNTVIGVIDTHYYNFRFLNEERGATMAEIREAAQSKDKDIVIRLDLDNWQGTLQYLGLVNLTDDGSTYREVLLFSTIKMNNGVVNTDNETISGTVQLEYWYTPLDPGDDMPPVAFVNCQFAEINLAPGASHAGSFMRVNEDGLWSVEKIDIIQPPVTAEVGQALSVKAVDETGKPIEWETIDCNPGIKRVESLDKENLVQLRDLETGPYILHGWFSPFPNSDISMTFDNTITIVARKDAGSHLFVLTGLNSKINFLEILVDETNEKGFTFTRTDFVLTDLHQLLSRVEELEQPRDSISLVDKVTGKTHVLEVSNGSLTMTEVTD